MMGRMPADLAVATAALTSGRGGSIIPISPMMVRSRSSDSSGRSIHCALIPNTLIPFWAICSLACWMRSRQPSSSG